MNDGSISKDLHRFFAAYFHQDWELEADSWEGVVDIYAADHPSVELLRRLAREIDGQRESRLEQDLEQFLVFTVGVCYGPKPLTYKEWLRQIADRLRQHANANDSGGASSL